MVETPNRFAVANVIPVGVRASILPYLPHWSLAEGFVFNGCKTED